MSRINLILIAVALTGCVQSSLPPPSDLTPTSDPATRLVRTTPSPILSAGTTVLREMGFAINDPFTGSERVYSEPLIIQSSWRGQAISRRVVCGVGSAAPSDPFRTNDLANTIPIEIRLGYSVEPRAERTATTVIFQAQGRREASVVPGTPSMSCTLTVPFVEELFAALEGQLRTMGDLEPL